MSAHVVPKGHSFSGQSNAVSSMDDEEEKTTLESGWEEEASTTVEQGEVAEKIRSMGLDPPRARNQITSTGSVVDEPTVDDQRGNAGLSMITPPAVLARMIITHGNDKGQEVEIIPGKGYTIGRAIDNDIVLTDIAVSRKHFDLRHENGAWVLADRGSGNGTLVNGNLEDQPFMLANGDLIEIGNTTFRFDFPNAPVRRSHASFADHGATNGFDPVTRSNGHSYSAIDEDEPSTVAGKPLRDSRASSIDTPHLQTPPMPELRTSRPKTVPPPLPQRGRPVSHPPPPVYPLGSQAPLPAALQATVAPHHGMPAMQPAMLGLPPQPQPAPPPMSPGRLLGAQAPTMLDQGMPQLQNVLPTTIPGQGLPVQPAQPHINQLPFTYPNVADHAQHAKMMVASNQIPRDATATAHVPPTPYNGQLAMPYTVYRAPTISRRTKLLLGGAGLAILAAIATVAIIKAASGGEDSEEVTSQPPETKPTIQPIVEPKKDPPKKDPVVVADPPKKDPPKVDPPKKDPVVADPPKKDPPKVDPPKKDPVVVADPPKTDPPKADPPKVDPPKRDPIVKRDPPKKDPPKKDPPKKDPPKRDREPRTATRDQVDTSVARTTAQAQFRNRKFNDAASTLKAAASKTSGSEAVELKSLAARYEQFGRNFNVGIAPQTKATEAWNRLNSARAYDSEGAFRDVISAKLSEIAGSAAMGFVREKEFPKALSAARLSGSSSTLGIVRDKINDYAAELYNQAAREVDSNPGEAKSKLRLIKGLVEPKSTWAVKADKLLAGL